jgi:hypothetical protein
MTATVLHCFMLSNKMHLEFRRGKPVFPKYTKCTTLVDLTDPDSCFLFDALYFGNMWLTQPSDTWPFETNFNSAEQLVENVNVVNNPTERGVTYVK